MPMLIGALMTMALAQAPARPATLSGQVLDADGRPAAGIEVLLSGTGVLQHPALARATSDRDGTFRIDLPDEKDPGQAHRMLGVWAYAPDRGLAGQAFSTTAFPAAGSVRLKLGEPAHASVRVIGPDRKPVTGARVRPGLVRLEGGLRPISSFPLPDPLADRLAATTGADGRGEIRGCRAVDIQAVRVEAEGFGLQACDFAAAGDGVTTITLKAAGRLIGRVQADDRSSAKGLKVLVLTQPNGSDRSQSSGVGETTTDADGRFEFAALATGKLAINVFPSEGKKLRPKLPSGIVIEPGRTTEVTIPLEGPARVRTVTGRVVDLKGQPVVDALVFQTGDSPTRTETTSGADGRFSLAGVVARPTFLFVRKPGYRFAGAAIGPASDDVTLTIHTVQEPPRVMRKTLPPTQPREEDLNLARRLLDPFAERALKEGGEPEKIWTLEALARVEPERALELIQQKKVFQIPFYNGMIGLRVAVGLMDESIDEALAVLEGMEDPGVKGMGILKAVDTLAARDRSRALALLDRALLNARAAREPDGIKLILMGQVAERFLDLGEADRGRAILREGEGMARSLPKAGFVGYARGAFAEELVQIDPEAALAIAKEIADPREFDRHHGNIAHELAGRDPARAERVLAMVKDQFQRDQFTVRVVYRMAPVDLDRARRLSTSIGDDALKGYALGMMALRLAETGKDPARAVLVDAYESLEQSSRAARKGSRSLYDITSIAGVLLLVAEKIDPKLVDECLWRTLAMRQPKPWETGPGDRTDYADVLLAMMLARYDRDIAKSLVEPLVRGDGRSRPYDSTRRGELVAAAAAIDPKWAVALVDAMPDDPDLKIQGPKNSARLAVANLLGRAGERRFRHIESSYLNLWVPDTEDHDPID